MVVTLAPTVSLLISSLLPWLSPTAGSEQQHTTDPFAHPSPRLSASSSDASPSPSPSVHVDSDVDDEEFQTDAGENGLPVEDQSYGSDDVPHVHQVSPDFPTFSQHSDSKHLDPGGTYTHFISHLGFEFGPDWILVPPGCTLDVEIKRPWCFDAFDPDENHIFSIKAGSNLAISMRNAGMRRVGKSVELSAGTYRVGGVGSPHQAMMYSRGIIPP
jgi:hypothetical protein